MEYVKNNINLFKKYGLIVISNIVIFILTNYYLKNFEFKYLVMILINTLIDLLIYYYKGKVIFNKYIDYIVNIIIGLIIIFFAKNIIEYDTILFSLLFSNNIVFIRSRLSEKFIVKSSQYLLMLFNTIVVMFIDGLIFNLIY